MGQQIVQNPLYKMEFILHIFIGDNLKVFTRSVFYFNKMFIIRGTVILW